MPSVLSKFRRAWNAFRNPSPEEYADDTAAYYKSHDSLKVKVSNSRTLINAIINRIAVDVSAVDIHHVNLDDQKRFDSIRYDSEIERCLTLEANIDQTGREYIHDLVYSMLDEGVVASVPLYQPYDTYSDSPKEKVLTFRTGRIEEWYPRKVKVNVYNDLTGKHASIIFSKRDLAIMESPFKSVMNDSTSIMQRLLRKLALIDMVDEKNSSGKLDIIIQLPYSARGDLQKERAKVRRKEIEDQLVGSKYGIAYIDASEHITQLNRPAENNLMAQVQYLTAQLMEQMSLSEEILNGTADEKVMRNYENNIIEPILSTITGSMKRAYLSKTALAQGQSIMFFRDMFRLIPVAEAAELADKLTRNEIVTTNEFRQKIGMVPSKDPGADELRNKNLSVPSGTQNESNEPGKINEPKESEKKDKNNNKGDD